MSTYLHFTSYLTIITLSLCHSSLVTSYFSCTLLLCACTLLSCDCTLLSCACTLLSCDCTLLSCDCTLLSCDCTLSCTQSKEGNYKVHSGSVDQLCWHPSKADVLVTASLDKTIRLWDARGTVMVGQRYSYGRVMVGQRYSYGRPEVQLW